MNKIMLHGAYFGKNFGDILLLKIIARWIHEMDRDIHVNLPFCPGINRRPIGADSTGFRAAKGAAGLVLGGGGYFGEPRYGQEQWSERNYQRYVKVGLDAVDAGLPIAVLGVGVGPISDKVFRQGVLNIVDSAKVVAVRDEESRNYLAEYGARMDNIAVTADSALTLHMLNNCDDFKRKVSDWRRKLVGSTGKKVVALHLQYDRSSFNYDGVVQQVLRWSERDGNVKVILISDRGVSFTDMLFRKVKRCLLRKSNIGIDDVQHTDLDDLISLIGACDGIVTSKLHVGIVATALGRNVLSIPWHPKTVRFYSQLGMQERCVVLEDASKIDMNYYLSSRADSLVVSQNVCARAWKNRELLVDFMQEHLLR